MTEQLDAGHVEILWQAPTDQFLDELADRMLRDIKRRKVKRLLKGQASADRRSLRFQESSSRETDRAFLFRVGP